MLGRVSIAVGPGSSGVPQDLPRKGGSPSAPSRVGPIALGLVVLLGALPLIWITLVETPIGDLKYAHIAGVVLLGACVMSARWWTALGAITAHYFVVVLATAAYLIALTAVDLYHAVTVAPELRQLLYAGTGLVVAAVILVILRDDEYGWRRRLGSALPVVLAVFLVAFGLSAIENNVDVIGTLSQSVSTADPSILEFRVFRPIFEGQGLAAEQVRANLRHEVFAAILLATLLAVYAWRGPPPRFTGPTVGQLVLLATAAVLIVLSLSRAIQLAVVITMLTGALAVAVRSRLSKKLAPFLILGLVLVIAAFFTGVYGLIWERIAPGPASSDASYITRVLGVGSAISAGLDAPFTGSDQRFADSHNFVLESFARGGFVPAAAAMTVFGAVLISVVTQSIRRISGFASAIPVPAIGLGVLVIVRMLTSGGGQLNLAEWIALGIYGAVVLHYQQVSRRKSESTHRVFPADEDVAVTHSRPPVGSATAIPQRGS